MEKGLPADWLPVMTWLRFFYDQQKQYTASTAWQTWFIGGNGTGKTLIVYNNIVMHCLGIHPKQFAEPPLKVKVLVPSFDYVEDVALEKLQAGQAVVFSKLSKDQEDWLGMMRKYRAIKGGDIESGRIEIGPMLPKSMVGKGYSKDHKGLELKNGSSIWFVTSEQGWQAQRGGEHDILAGDEEGDERVWDELKRGLRNAKGGGKIYAGLTPPYQLGQGPTWTKDQILDASIDDPEIDVVRACMADNPAITKKFIEEFSKGKTKKQINVQIYGQYPSWGDLVHPGFEDTIWSPAEVKGHLLANDTPMPENHDVDWVMAFDWHPAKPCAAVFGYIDRSKNFTIFDELDKDWAEGKEISDLAEGFFSIEGQPHYKRKFRRWQDPSAKSTYNAVKRGFNAWDAFRKNGIITAAGKNRDPMVGVNLVNEYFRGNGKDSPRIFIYERCKYTRQFLNNHYWQRSESGSAAPDAKWSDYPICIRYIIQETSWKNRGLEKRWPLRSYESLPAERPAIDLGRWAA